MLEIDTIDNILPRTRLVSDGSLQSITPAFELLDSKYVLVYFGDQLQENSSYAVNLSTNTISFLTAVPLGTTVTVLRAVPANWLETIREKGALDLDQLNSMFVEMVAKIQTIEEQVSRAPTMPVYEDMDSESYTEFFFKSLKDAMDVLDASKSNLNDLQTEGDRIIGEAEAEADRAETAATNAANSAQQALVAANHASSGNIGDIKYSARIGDAPAGGEWCDGSSYTKAQYPDLYQMLVDNKLRVVPIDDYESKLSSSGSCGYFGLDTANESFKVPSLNDVYVKIGSTGVAEFGAESLPNHIHTSLIAGNLDGNPDGGADSGGGRGYWRYGTTQYDTTGVKNSSVYQDGAKVNPDHIVYRAYVMMYSATAEFSIRDYTDTLEATTTAGVAEITTAKTDAVTTIATDKNDAVTAIATDKNDAVTTIAADKTTAITAITDTKNEALAALDNSLDTLEQRVEAYSPRTFNLFDTKWSDHIQNDVSWLRADTFSWQDGEIYTSAYNELLSEYSNNDSTTETEGDITYKRTPNGYKIADSSQMSAILSLYESTGVAWFYILDTENTRFKLPRTKYGFVGTRSGVGNYVEESLPNITAKFSGNGDNSRVYSGEEYKAGSGAIQFDQNGGPLWYANATAYAIGDWSFDASRVSSTYQDGAPVQQRATEMYLYFFVGNTVQNQTEVDLGKVTELVNDYELVGFDATIQEKTAVAETEINNIAQDAIDAVIAAGGELKAAVAGNIGDIKYTVRKGPAPFGGVWCDGSTYTKGKYPDIWTLLTENKLEAVDIDTYNSVLALNGSCGFIGVDTATESFKVPSLNDVYIKSGQVAAEFGAESLPNITGNYTHTLQNRAFTVDGVFADTYGTTDIYYSSATSGGKECGFVNFNANNSSSTYQDGAKVNPDHVCYRAYIILFSGQDITSDVHIEAQLNNPFFLGMSQYFESEPKNASWLISNGSFHSGATYVSFYEWLLKIYNGTETVDGVSVKLSTEAYTDTDYVINTADTTFRLPLYNQRVLVKRYVNGTDWYDWYSDGWCVQGGRYTAPGDGNYTVDLIKAFRDTDYSLTQWSGFQNTISNQYNNGLVVVSMTNSSFMFNSYDYNSTLFWQACGYASVPVLSDYTVIKGLYYYVGETIQDANVIAASNVLTEIANLKGTIINLSNTSGTVSLEANKIYSISIEDTTTFSLPATVDTNYFNQIKVMAKVTGTPVIAWGTTNFFNKATPEIEAGSYDFYFDYDNLLGAWVAGAMPKGASE